MSRMGGGIGGAVWAGYGSLLGDEPPHSVAMVLESCPDNRDSGQEWTSGSHRRVHDRRAITKIIAACHVHPRLNIIIGHHQGMSPVYFKSHVERSDAQDLDHQEIPLVVFTTIVTIGCV